MWEAQQLWNQRHKEKLQRGEINRLYLMSSGMMYVQKEFRGLTSQVGRVWSEVKYKLETGMERNNNRSSLLYC